MRARGAPARAGPDPGVSDLRPLRRGAASQFDSPGGIARLLQEIDDGQDLVEVDASGEVEVLDVADRPEELRSRRANDVEDTGDPGGATQREGLERGGRRGQLGEFLLVRIPDPGSLSPQRILPQQLFEDLEAWHSKIRHREPAKGCPQIEQVSFRTLLQNAERRYHGEPMGAGLLDSVPVIHQESIRAQLHGQRDRFALPIAQLFVRREE